MIAGEVEKRRCFPSPPYSYFIGFFNKSFFHHLESNPYQRITYIIKGTGHIYHFNTAAHEQTVEGPAIDGKYPNTITELLMTVFRTLSNIVYTSAQHPTKRSTNNRAHQIVARQKCYRMDTDRHDCKRLQVWFCGLNSRGIGAKSSFGALQPQEKIWQRNLRAVVPTSLQPVKNTIE